MVDQGAGASSSAKASRTVSFMNIRTPVSTDIHNPLSSGCINASSCMQRRFRLCDLTVYACLSLCYFLRVARLYFSSLSNWMKFLRAKECCVSLAEKKIFAYFIFNNSNQELDKFACLVTRFTRLMILNVCSGKRSY